MCPLRGRILITAVVPAAVVYGTFITNYELRIKSLTLAKPYDKIKEQVLKGQLRITHYELRITNYELLYTPRKTQGREGQAPPLRKNRIPFLARNYKRTRDREKRRGVACSARIYRFRLVIIAIE